MNPVRNKNLMSYTYLVKNTKNNHFQNDIISNLRKLEISYF